MMKPGTLVNLTYGWETISETFYRPIFETGMFLRVLDDGREEVLFPDLRIIQVSPAKVSVRCYLDNPCYSTLRAELFPTLAAGAEHEVSGGVLVPAVHVAA